MPGKKEGRSDAMKGPQCAREIRVARMDLLEGYTAGVRLVYAGRPAQRLQ